MLRPKRITKTRSAENDLIDIWFYSFSEWGEAIADEYLDQLNSGIKRLCENPDIGMDCHVIREGYRRYQINRHLVFYRIKKTEIEIIRVLHDSMDIESHFK
jgi:toxin ParE1/3/4